VYAPTPILWFSIDAQALNRRQLIPGVDAHQAKWRGDARPDAHVRSQIAEVELPRVRPHVARIQENNA
jgi:hypothetical protein